MHAACTLQPSQRGTLQARNILSVDTVARPDGFVLGPLPGSVPGEGLPWNLLVLARPLRARLQLFDDACVESGGGVTGGDGQGVLDRPLARAAVADDADTIDAEKGSAAVLAVVVTADEVLQGLLRQRA